MKRFLALLLAITASAAVLVAAEPADGVRQAGAGWRQGAIRQDKALLQRYLPNDLVYTHGGGKTAVLTGFVDVKPARGDVYRVRTLEVYTQNSNGDWQMAQKESVRVPLK